MKVAVLGSGAFGYAIANMLLKNGHDVTIWAHDKKDIELLNNGKTSKKLKFTNSYKEALDNTKIIFIMVSAKFLNNVARDIKPYIKSDMHFCIGSKGIEEESGKLVHQVFNDHIKTRKLSIISGPSFAIDMINNEPIGFAIATRSKQSREKIKEVLRGDSIKLRNSSDLIGVQLCGSIKNVIAVAAGILDGLGYHESTRAFLITESINDIKEVLDALGGNKKTVLSFAGIGDLLLTCTSEKSRNYSYGILIGKGDKKGAQHYLNTTTVEGYYTLKSIYTLLKRKKIKMPVIDLIYKIIMKDANPHLLADFLINK